MLITSSLTELPPTSEAAPRGDYANISDRAVSNLVRSYCGYLASHVECIRAMHLAGADTRTIAEELYQRGVRAQTTNPYFPKMRRIHHVANLRVMTLHVLHRLGLRARRRRTQRWPRP